MKIRTSITVKIDGYPEYTLSEANRMIISDLHLDLLTKEQGIRDFKDCYRVALADAGYNLTNKLIDTLRQIAEERKVE